MKLKARWNIKHDNKLVTAGHTFEADEATAELLIKSGAAVPETETEAEAESSAKPTKAKKAKASE